MSGLRWFQWGLALVVGASTVALVGCNAPAPAPAPSGPVSAAPSSGPSASPAPVSPQPVGDAQPVSQEALEARVAKEISQEAGVPADAVCSGALRPQVGQTQKCVATN